MNNLQERIEKRNQIREAHEPVFAKLKEKFNARAFPDDKMQELVLEVRKVDGFHNQNGDRHRTTQYKLYEPMYELFGIEWSYTFCHECQKIIKKRGVLLDQVDNSAYIREFPQDGMTIERVISPSNAAEFFAKGVTNDE